MNTISFILDGRLQTLDFAARADITPTTTVLQYLRSLPGHTGTKEGCAEGDCGACTVVLAEPDGARLRYDAVDSCLLLLPMLHGRQLITVENLHSAGTLHPVQQAMVDHHGSQCGFCTPGIVMTLFALAQGTSPLSDEEIRIALAGNLCRCTGYRPIIDAARTAASGHGKDDIPREERKIADILARIPPSSLHVTSGEQTYFRPDTLSEALHLRLSHPSAVIVNGATDVALRITKNHQRIPEVLDLSGIPELRMIETGERAVQFGAGVTIRRLQDACRDRFPSLAAYAGLFGSLQIRSLATIGGNIGTASPVGDSLPVFIAHDAEILLASTHGTRRVPAASFATGYRKTACAPMELITGLSIPFPANGTAIRWYKVTRRRDVDIATVSAAFRLERNGDGTAGRIVLAYGGMAERTRRAELTERFLEGKPWTRGVVDGAMKMLENEFTPLSDVRGSARFRTVAARNLLLKFWSETAGEADR